jgi:hypothetical protein
MISGVAVHGIQSPNQARAVRLGLDVDDLALEHEIGGLQQSPEIQMSQDRRVRAVWEHAEGEDGEYRGHNAPRSSECLWIWIWNQHGRSAHVERTSVCDRHVCPGEQLAPYIIGNLYEVFT